MQFGKQDKQYDRWKVKVFEKGSRKRFPKKVPQKGSQESFGIKACKLNFVVSGAVKF